MPWSIYLSNNQNTIRYDLSQKSFRHTKRAYSMKMQKKLVNECTLRKMRSTDKEKWCSGQTAACQSQTTFSWPYPGQTLFITWNSEIWKVFVLKKCFKIWFYIIPPPHKCQWTTLRISDYTRAYIRIKINISQNKNWKRPIWGFE